MTMIGRSFFGWLAILLLTCAAVSAALSFYEGSVRINDIEGEVVLGQDIMVRMIYHLTGSEEVTLGFPGFQEITSVRINGETVQPPYVMDIDGSATLNVTARLSPEGDVTRSLTVNPDLNLDGGAYAEKIPSHTLDLFTPYPITQSSKEPGFKDEGTSNRYTWSFSDVYSTSVSFSWNEQDIDVEVVREVPEFILGGFTVTTTVTNNGGVLEDVLLITSFRPSDFIPRSNQEEFSEVVTGNDIRTEWRKPIASLGAGESRTFTYDLEINDKERLVVLRPVSVYVSDSFVYESERLELIEELQDELSELNESQEEKVLLEGAPENAGGEEGQATPAEESEGKEEEQSLTVSPADGDSSVPGTEGAQEEALRERLDVPEDSAGGDSFLGVTPVSHMIAVIALVAVGGALGIAFRSRRYDHELLAFIEKHLQKGYSHEQLHDHLVHHGFSSRKVRRHLRKFR